MRLRRRYSNLIDTQLDLFATDNAGLLERVAEARESYNAARREDAEDEFGEYQAWIADAGDELGRLRDTYASTLDPDAAEEYRHAFERAVLRRFPDLILGLEEEDVEEG